MRKNLYSFLLAAIAMIFATNTSAQTTYPKEIIDGSDNVLSIVVKSTGDITKIPVTLALSNPNTDITSAEATLFAPVDVRKFVFDEEEEDFMYVKSSRLTKGHSPVLSAGTEEHGADGFYISIADSKTRNFKGNEGDLITVYFDGSELGNGEYVVQMKDAISVAVGDMIYNSVNMDAAFTVINGVVIGTEGEAPIATGISLNKESLTINKFEGATLVATVTPAQAIQEVEWESSNDAVLTVDAEGNIFPAKNGTAIITATTTDDSDLSAECEVTVNIPSMFQADVTQTTVTIGADGATTIKVKLGNDVYTSENGVATVTGLAPGTTYHAVVDASINGHPWTEELDVTTKDIDVTVNGTASPTTINLTVTYDAGNATVTRASFDAQQIVNEINESQLEPNKTYTYTYYITTEEGGVKGYPVEFSTTALEITTPQVTVVSQGEVQMTATTNITEENVTVGLEWATNPQTGQITTTGTAYFFDGSIDGLIKNLDGNTSWKARPYYEAKSGNRFYGEWKSFNVNAPIVANPLLHTYRPIVEGNKASIKGVVLDGTREIIQRGFYYWEVIPFFNNGKSPKYPQATDIQVPSYAKMLIVDGELMTAELENLQYELEYHFVAFAKTSEGETCYGEEQNLFIPDPTGLHSTETTATANGNVRVYNLNGALVYTGARENMNLNKGIYIVRPVSGKAQKLIVR
ncbi:MAG: Ig-like domain-containing protein [Bacteroidaceae bacterium]|nr:Ig-like domain-containing protein [Bacteroidaceae bacterium]